MSQHDFDIANQGFPATRSDMNLAFVALATNSSGATEPSTTFAYQWWSDTTAGLLKQRNAANNAWITIGTLASVNLGLQADVITTRGDVIRGSSAGAAERLALGINGQALVSDGTDAAWSGVGVLETEQATTSGTAIDFTGIPSWVKRITIMLDQVSTNGSSIPMIQVGDAGGIETTGYVGASGLLAGTPTVTTFTEGFYIGAGWGATVIISGRITLSLEDSANNTWVANGMSGRSDSAQVHSTGGVKPLTGTLDRIRFTMVNGTDAFDAGAVNIIYE